VSFVTINPIRLIARIAPREEEAFNLCIILKDKGKT
jgi:hypothetical protein